eukprot:jgi/Mesen1/7414/ME000388S06628
MVLLSVRQPTLGVLTPYSGGLCEPQQTISCGAPRIQCPRIQASDRTPMNLKPLAGPLSNTSRLYMKGPLTTVQNIAVHSFCAGSRAFRGDVSVCFLKRLGVQSLLESYGSSKKDLFSIPLSLTFPFRRSMNEMVPVAEGVLRLHDGMSQVRMNVQGLGFKMPLLWDRSEPRAYAKATIFKALGITSSLVEKQGDVSNTWKGDTMWQRWFGGNGRDEEESGSGPAFRIDAPGQRVLAIGDLHGDWEQTLAALRLAGVISGDNSMSWTGGSAILVQVGDILDRGDDEIAILSLLRYLNVQAQQHGGAVYQINGNHETMNVSEEFRYVTEGGYAEGSDFVTYCTDVHGGNWNSAFAAWWYASQDIKAQRKTALGPAWGAPLSAWNPLVAQKRTKARSMLFRPGGPIALQLARHPCVMLINDTLYAHGGVLPHHVEYGLQRMNRELSHWMRGECNEKGEVAPMPFVATRGFNSVVWSRLYSREAFDSGEDRRRVSRRRKAVGPRRMRRRAERAVVRLLQRAGLLLPGFKLVPVKAAVAAAAAAARRGIAPPGVAASLLFNPCSSEACAALEAALDAVGARRLVVGHTPQMVGANSECGGRVWRIDVGMSSGILNAPPQVLEINGGNVQVLSSEDAFSSYIETS